MRTNEPIGSSGLLISSLQEKEVFRITHEITLIIWEPLVETFQTSRIASAFKSSPPQQLLPKRTSQNSWKNSKSNPARVILESKRIAPPKTHLALQGRTSPTE
jgi:hypothetical protein